MLRWGHMASRQIFCPLCPNKNFRCKILPSLFRSSTVLVLAHLLGQGVRVSSASSELKHWRKKTN